jgi:hypothetical protein
VNEQPSNLDRLALRQGASVTLLFSVPPTLVARFLLDDEPASSSWPVLLSLIALFGFIIGAGVAASRQNVGSPYTHGMVASTGTFIAVQAAIVLVKLAVGDDVRWSRVVSSLTLALFASVVGALLGSIVQRNAPHMKNPS